MDKIVIFAVIMIFVTCLFAFTTNEYTSVEDCMIGIVNDIEERDTGYIFDFTDEKGNIIKCFSKTKISNFSMYEIFGVFSEDKEIFFVNSIIEYNT